MSERIIRVTGKGKLSVKPDTICLTIKMQGTYPEYEESIRKSTEHTAKLREVIEASGLPGKDLKTTYYNIDTTYESYRDKHGNYKKKFIGYSYHHHTTISFPNDNKQLGKVLYELAHCPVQVEFSINYTVKDREKVKNELLKKAVEDSTDKAKELTKAASVTLGKILNINYSWGEIEIHSRPLSIIADSFTDKMSERSYDIDIEADDINVSDTVTIEWEIQ